MPEKKAGFFLKINNRKIREDTMNIDFLIKNKEHFHKMVSLGQSPWLDNISRCMIDSGDLKKMVDNGIITGITSNPSIFEKSINSGKCGYPELIKKLASEKKDTFTIYDSITREDIKNAAKILKPVYERTNGNDGFVSIEVPPDIATDVKTSISEAERIFGLINEKNVFIKIPATKEGLEAIKVIISKGINVNVTLMFSLDHYVSVANSYLEGLENGLKNGLNIKNVHSVASVFVSRVETLADKMLNEIINNPGQDHEKKETALKLTGKAAVANAKIIFNKYNEIFKGETFTRLEEQGGNVQRLLWASTSTKNPAYYDLKYVEPLVGKNTVNTLPDNTVENIADHGNIIEDSAANELAESLKIQQELSSIGVDLNQVGEKLQIEGIKSFEDSYKKLLESINKISAA